MIYDMIQKLQEAMTEDIVLPEGFELILQMDGGVQTIKKDETKEKQCNKAVWIVKESGVGSDFFVW